MPELRGWYRGFRLDRHLHCDRVSFEGTLRCDLTVHGEGRCGPGHTAIQQRHGKR